MYRAKVLPLTIDYVNFMNKVLKLKKILVDG